MLVKLITRSKGIRFRVTSKQQTMTVDDDDDDKYADMYEMRWVPIMIPAAVPFALAVIGRWSKRPSILFVLFPVAFVAFAVVCVAVHVLSVKFFPSMEI
nr:unnamed protein product [Digitaria exilis]